MTLIYKILSMTEWNDAQRAGVFLGSAIDRQDGYIHFSAGPQVKETAARYFAGQDGLMLVAFDAASFGESLRWEKSRGGDLFPHFYGPLDPTLMQWAKPLPWTDSGHSFPQESGA
jgi:uncharacterized protein (DUF952 family)